ncbi:MAG: hypothetical protein AAGE01_19835, partial [Pseudomonadota bacterium]
TGKDHNRRRSVEEVLGMAVIVTGVQWRDVSVGQAVAVFGEAGLQRGIELALGVCSDVAAVFRWFGLPESNAAAPTDDPANAVFAALRASEASVRVAVAVAECGSAQFGRFLLPGPVTAPAPVLEDEAIRLGAEIRSSSGADAAWILNACVDSVRRCRPDVGRVRWEDHGSPRHRRMTAIQPPPNGQMRSPVFEGLLIA